LLAVVGVLAVGLIGGALYYFNLPKDDFGPLLVEMESAVIEDASTYAQQWAPWVDPGSAEVELVDSGDGDVYKITFESQPGTGEEGFAPEFIVLIDPISGERVFMEAP
jgi:hypothetical protein